MFLIIALGPIRTTVELYLENNALEQQVLQAEKAPGELEFYRQEALTLQKVIHFNEADRDLKEDILLNAAAATEQNKSLLIRLQEPSVHTENDFRIETYEVVLQGDYVNLLKVLMYLEDHLEAGKIVSARFVLVKKESTERVMAHIYIQTSKGQYHEQKTETAP